MLYDNSQEKIRSCLAENELQSDEFMSEWCPKSETIVNEIVMEPSYENKQKSVAVEKEKSR